MARQLSYPGVYIDEFTPGAPIQGVGTSTAAFIGAASQGEKNLPTKITRWKQFKTLYGERPLRGSYLWYAVRGFFDNGGQVCYVVRASNGGYDQENLPNGTAAPETVAIVRARQMGTRSGLQVTIDPDSQAIGTLYRPSGTVDTVTSEGRVLGLRTAGEAANFRAGDTIQVDAETAQIVQVNGRDNSLRLDRALPEAAGQVVTLAGGSGLQTVRVEPPATGSFPPGALVPGTVLSFMIGTGGPEEEQVVESVQAEYLPTEPPQPLYRVTLRNALALPLNMDPSSDPVNVEAREIRLTVINGGTTSAYGNLGTDPDHPRYYIDYVNENDPIVRLERTEPQPMDGIPTAGTFTLAGGTPENLAGLSSAAYVEALEALSQIDDVNLIAIPGVTDSIVQLALIDHCQQMGDRFAILDSRAELNLFGPDSIEGARAGLESTRGFAALYYPWLWVPPAGSGRQVLVPPSGHICGVIARSDAFRGVHKAPANEIVSGALDVETKMSDIEQGQLNLQGINVIRVFKGGRPVVWGARTTASDTNWQYVNIRRLFLYLEESIEEGIRWAIFEPNNLQLWGKLKRTISEFLTRVWRDGGLFGETAEDAFYVRIDETLNPDSERALGRLYIEIGLRPSYPAEFIVVRIGIWHGGSDVAEG